jgi:hypothetical protein
MAAVLIECTKEEERFAVLVFILTGEYGRIYGRTAFHILRYKPEK